jgi:CheY-like chemotaxis protein
MNKIAGARILLVEDNPFNKELATTLLQKANAIVTAVNHGQEALETLAAYPDSYDGVIMDCQMPVMDGFTATRQIRQNAKWSDLPILAMTANVLSTDRQKVLDAGMNEYLAKPINIDVFYQQVADWIKPKARLQLERKHVV